VVDDPYSDTGGKITVTVSLRDDTLGTLYADGRITRPQWEAGERLREQLRQVEFGKLKAVNYSNEPVDGGGAYMDYGAERRAKAYDSIKAARAKLGRQTFALVRDVIATDIAELRTALDKLALHYGLQNRQRGFDRHDDKYSALDARRVA
jgi:hypothetical protein